MTFVDTLLYCRYRVVCRDVLCDCVLCIVMLFVCIESCFFAWEQLLLDSCGFIMLLLLLLHLLYFSFWGVLLRLRGNHFLGVEKLQIIFKICMKHTHTHTHNVVLMCCLMKNNVWKWKFFLVYIVMYECVCVCVSECTCKYVRGCVFKDCSVAERNECNSLALWVGVWKSGSLSCSVKMLLQLLNSFLILIFQMLTLAHRQSYSYLAWSLTVSLSVCPSFRLYK